MNDSLEKLLASLQPEQLDRNLFRGVTWPPRDRRVYGGQVLAQALHAAIQSIEDGKRVHSKHAYFLRPGDPSKPIIYAVDPIRDGRSFATRRVVASQDGNAIFTSAISFQLPEGGPAHQIGMPDVPEPESIENDAEYYARLSQRSSRRRSRPREELGMDYRTVVKMDHAKPTPREPVLGVWMRANGKLPADSALHVTLLAYMSDNYLMSPTMLPLAVGWASEGVMTASLDHALWFHDDFRADEWLYYDIRCTRYSHSRGINHGSIYTRDGRLVATAMQEGLVRVPR